MTKRIAIYGKGGIGKSTIASNIAAYAACINKSVLQIGCDPKHDSTLLLLGKQQDTILSKINNLNDCTYEKILQTSKYGVDCVEIGGPPPGVGCAGRGIIKGMDIIEQLNVLNKKNYDLIIYDVLGDVVCGGFFEPVKNNRIEEIYIVSSGEFNSLFAANNICSGYNNCKLHSRGITLAGIIGNYRNAYDEAAILKEFCKQVGIPLVAELNRDNSIEEATRKGIPFVLEDTTTNSSLCIANIFRFIEKPSEQDIEPTPLSLYELRKIINGVI